MGSTKDEAAKWLHRLHGLCATTRARAPMLSDLDGVTFETTCRPGFVRACVALDAAGWLDDSKVSDAALWRACINHAITRLEASDA